MTAQCSVCSELTCSPTHHRLCWCFPFPQAGPGAALGRTIWGVLGLGAFGFQLKEVPAGKHIITTTRSHSNKLVTDCVTAMNPDDVLRVGGAGNKVRNSPPPTRSAVDSLKGTRELLTKGQRGVWEERLKIVICHPKHISATFLNFFLNVKVQISVKTLQRKYINWLVLLSG